MANICAVLRGQISTSSSRPFFRLTISYIMKSEIKKVYFVPHKYIWNIWMTLKCGVKLTTPKGTPLMALCIDFDLKAKVTLFNPNFSFFRPSFLVFFSSISFIFFSKSHFFRPSFTFMANSSPKSLFSLSFTFSGKPRFRFVRSNFCLSKFYFKAKVLPIMPKFHLFFLKHSFIL